MRINLQSILDIISAGKVHALIGDRKNNHVEFEAWNLSAQAFFGIYY